MGRLRSRSRSCCRGGFRNRGAIGRIACDIRRLSYNIFNNVMRELLRKMDERKGLNSRKR